MRETTIDITAAIPVAPAKPETDDAQLTEFVWYILLTLVSVWGISILTFGLAGLIVPALLLVPVVFVGLILITAGG